MACQKLRACACHRIVLDIYIYIYIYIYICAYVYVNIITYNIFMIVVYSTANGQQLPRIDKMMPWTFETSFPKEGATSAGTSGDGEIHHEKNSGG